MSYSIRTQRNKYPYQLCILRILSAMFS